MTVRTSIPPDHAEPYAAPRPSTSRSACRRSHRRASRRFLTTAPPSDTARCPVVAVTSTA
ncbi:hypothetical protein [Streptomyces sp. NPDC059814]|uniref:hypothetical protein n=1 Tax=unclassified Streptomyces TaxID=2593676 RepID=UPI003656C0A7